MAALFKYMKQIRKWIYLHSSCHRQMVILGYLALLEKRLKDIEKKLDE